MLQGLLFSSDKPALKLYDVNLTKYKLCTKLFTLDHQKKENMGITWAITNVSIDFTQVEISTKRRRVLRFLAEVPRLQ